MVNPENLKLALKEGKAFFLAQSKKHIIALSDCYYRVMCYDCGCDVAVHSLEPGETINELKLYSGELQEITKNEFRNKWISCTRPPVFE